MKIATQTEKTEIKSVAKDTANGLTLVVTELKGVKIMITTKKEDEREKSYQRLKKRFGI